MSILKTSHNGLQKNTQWVKKLKYKGIGLKHCSSPLALLGMPEGPYSTNFSAYKAIYAHTYSIFFSVSVFMLLLFTSNSW